jgi:NADPH-dependent 2,4-dienoyl-CoA reductase/sulfur reductase-like enzyme
MDLAEEALAAGQADVVAMIRAFIADPDQVNKARLGRGDEIRPCIRCCICTGDDPHGCPKPLRCSVNPQSGRNPEFDRIEKSEQQKKVVVVGGGAAGMEAVRRLTERGHTSYF